MIQSVTAENLKSLNDLRLVKLDVRARLERLSSGMRINRAADDPSGLAISKGMTARNMGLNTCLRNIQDGISLIRTMDGAIEEINGMLGRMRDLSVRAGNEAPFTADDRGRLQDEFQSLRKEVDRTAHSTKFNSKPVFGDKERMIYRTLRDGNMEIYATDSDGLNTANLSNNSIGLDQSPALSPDGTKIAFETVRGATYQIYLMDTDGSNQINLTNNAAKDRFAKWSPDGSKILFNSDRAGDYEIYTMNADGSNPVNLTNNPANDYFDGYTNPWNPEGTKIGFRSDRDGDPEIYIMDADGGSPARVTDSPGYDYFYGFLSSPAEYQQLQVGPDNGAEQRVELLFPRVTAHALGLDTLDSSTVPGAQLSIGVLDTSISELCDARAEIGITHRRLLHIANDNNVALINTAASNSIIEDADMAEEFTAFT